MLQVPIFAVTPKLVNRYVLLAIGAANVGCGVALGFTGLDPQVKDGLVLGQAILMFVIAQMDSWHDDPSA